LRARIHRGAKEVGGSCVELEAEGKRLLLDIGLPLRSGLAEKAQPPGLRGVIASRDLLGVVISHGHPDHYGLAFQLDRRVPIYMGRAASEILNGAAFFMSPPAEKLHPKGFLEDLTPIDLGPFKITPYLVDHSAFDSYALLVEASGRRLFYTGDLRAHGRKPGTFERLLRDPPTNIHAMLMEGTRLSRTDDAQGPQSELEVQQAFEHEFQTTQGTVLAMYSPQNIDRYVSIYRAARRARRDLVVDLYTATVAAATGLESIPQAHWDGVRVFVPFSQRVAVKRSEEFERVNALGGSRVFPEELNDVRGDLVMTFRPSMARDLADARCLESAHAIWSMWPGYLQGSTWAKLDAFLKRVGMTLSMIHCSGHATTADLQRLAKAMSGDKLVPIHTEVPERFDELFERVERNADGEWWEV
jgi:ribonuclease J